jgi:small-conductance mechanosensitive channel
MHRLRTLAISILLLTAVTGRTADVPATTSRPEDILRFLNQTVVWYRQLASQQQLVNEPSDAVFLSDNRHIADEAVRLAFDFARSESQQIVKQAPAGPALAQNQPNPSQYQNLVNRSEKSKQQVKEEEDKLASMRQQLTKATGKKRATLDSAIAASEDELEFLKARSETIENILQFASGMSAWTGPKGLQAQIEELAQTVPVAATAGHPSATAGNPPSAAGASTATPIATSGEKQAEPGLFGLITQIFEYRRKLALLDNSLQLTESLADSAKTLRSPMGARMKELTQRSDQLAGQQSQDAAILAQQQSELKDLTRQYKQLSAAILPLGKQNLLFDLYKRNVSNWQNAVENQYSQSLKTLLVRLGTLSGIVVLILGASFLWRRATFRYVQDSRRRHQFLILRRIIVIPLLLIIIVVAFANGLGSVTLFAGLSTAGLAVALQNLLQALVGYFVLIGKLGVRVGDRVQVGGVTGEVIDVGMLRLHLMEMSPGPGSRPTGRVVAFANSVVFQPNAGLFKQIPGTNFAWHEVSLIVGADTDYRQLEKRMLLAVNRIFRDYQEKMELQRRSMENAIHGLSAEPLHPESRLYLTPTGTQVAVRYPVGVDDAAEIDNRIAREVLDATGQEPVVEPSTHGSEKTHSTAAGQET